VTTIQARLSKGTHEDRFLFPGVNTFQFVAHLILEASDAGRGLGSSEGVSDNFSVAGFSAAAACSATPAPKGALTPDASTFTSLRKTEDRALRNSGSNFSERTATTDGHAAALTRSTAVLTSSIQIGVIA
jgi:hypothetical protein